MPATVLLAPVGAGKTEAALRTLSRVIHNPARPFARAWVLLATRRQEVAFRQRLIELDDGRAIYCNVEFFSFYALNARLLNRAGRPQRRIDDAARLGLLRRLLAQMTRTGELQRYANIAETPGFVQLMRAFIDELKQNRVLLADFEAAAQSAKDREIALMYRRYQELLQAHRLVDAEGEGWLAYDAVVDHPQLAEDVDLLLVDGYDQFTYVQAMLLGQLARQMGEVAITLTSVPGREHTIGRRFQRALDRLREAHEAAGVRLQTQLLEGETARHPQLHALSAHLFERDHAPIPAEDRIQLLTAPEPADEAAAILRRVKALLLQGVPADEVLIALRDWPRYHEAIANAGRRYGVPLRLHHERELARQPVMAVLMDALNLAERGFRRGELLDVLRSPYVQAAGMDAAQIDALDRLSRRFQVTGGRDQWLEAVERASVDELDDDGEPVPALLDTSTATELSISLEDLFDTLTPPRQGDLGAFVQWIEDLIGPDPVRDPDDDFDEADERHAKSLRLIENVRAVDDDALVSRDIAALDALKRLLRGFLSTQDLLSATLGLGEPLTWPVFLRDLKLSIANATLHHDDLTRDGHVLVTTATDARGLPHPHVFVPGLAEGLFPAEQSEDPLYLDSERLALRERGVRLQTRAERADDDGLFYELISLPRHTLTLSRPTVREGKVWNESHLWRMTRAVFDALPRENIGVGQAVPVNEVAAPEEALLTLADGLRQGARDAALLRLHRWFRMQHGDLWSRILHGRAVERERLSRRPHAAYSGRLTRPASLAYVAEVLGPARVWSASQFNELSACRFRFFARRLLRLEALEEPEIGLDILQRGTLNHSILEETYGRIAAEGLSLTADDAQRDEALSILHEAAEDILRDAPQRLGFRPSRLWEREKGVLLRRLENVVRLDFSAEHFFREFSAGERNVHALEWRFGLGDQAPVTLSLSADDAPEKVRVRGAIDRVDRVGDALVVVDYKSSRSGPSRADMEQGRNVQMLVYLLAAEAIVRRQRERWRMAGGLFWALHDPARPHGLMRRGNDQDEEAIAAAQAHLVAAIRRARSGDFAVQPAHPTDKGRCSAYCEFYALCRVSVTNQRKRASDERA